MEILYNIKNGDNEWGLGFSKPLQFCDVIAEIANQASENSEPTKGE